MPTLYDLNDITFLADKKFEEITKKKIKMLQALLQNIEYITQLTSIFMKTDVNGCRVAFLSISDHG